MVVSKEQEATWLRNFNPLSPAVSARWPTHSGVYEPLLVFDSIHGRWIPWLAEAWAFSDDARTLTLTLRSGVRWSDGHAFSAADVAFTIELMRRFPALDRRALWSFIAAIETEGDHLLRVRFSRAFLPGFDDIVSVRPVPMHIWASVADPVTWPNENPVATGPFTEVRLFSAQVFELGKNPYYWQPGKPKIEALRMPVYPSNDRANLALAFDEVDWAGNFVPAIDRVFVARDRQHHHYWFPLTGSTVFLYPNTQKPPFDDVRVRKAISRAIDRASLVHIALHGYSRPADATALSDAFASYRDDGIAASGDWVRFAPKEAESAQRCRRNST
jgi:peptide/nickel transport system substrate-binding protein